MKQTNLFDQETLKGALSYNPDTGEFRWLRGHGGVQVGGKAGYMDDNGRHKLNVFGRCYIASRLAWFYMLGWWPDQIDHIDRDCANNIWSNLREATHHENQQNKSVRSDSSTGYKGVFKVNNRFKARITANGAIHHLGYFDTAEDAHAAFKDAALKLCGEFAAW